jgi:hypothetical protein
MQGVGIGLILLGYCAWYTLYQRTSGDGSSYLYNLTGSTRFPGPITKSSDTTTVPKGDTKITLPDGSVIEGPPKGAGKGTHGGTLGQGLH